MSSPSQYRPLKVPEVAASNKEFGEQCLKFTGPLLQYVDTVSAARDLDLLRAVLGDKKLNYLGYSYGTFLGATYADLYPEKTGRLVTVEENPRLCGWGAEIASIAADECFWSLDGPIVRITTPHLPLPAADQLEDATVPSVERIVREIRERID